MKTIALKRLKSSTAALLALCLAAESAVLAAPPADPSAFALALPASSGFISASYRPAGQAGQTPDIVFIQDLHANRSVQFAISRVLARLKKAGWLPDAIAMEGATGPVDVQAMQAAPKRGVRRQTADFLVNHGEMPGTLHFVVTEGAGHLYGVEDAAYYEGIVDAYRGAAQDGDNLRAELATLKAALPLVHAAHGDAQTHLETLSHDLDALQALISVQVPRDDLWPTLRRATEGLGQLKALVKGTPAEAAIKPAAAAIDFYALALLREPRMFKNLLALKAQERQSTSVFVVGGFHTQGLTELCKARKLSYVVITPDLKVNNAVDQKLYVDHMMGRDMTADEAFTVPLWTLPTQAPAPLNPDGPRIYGVLYRRFARALKFGIIGLLIASALPPIISKPAFAFAFAPPTAETTAGQVMENYSALVGVNTRNNYNRQHPDNDSSEANRASEASAYTLTGVYDRSLTSLPTVVAASMLNDQNVPEGLKKDLREKLAATNALKDILKIAADPRVTLDVRQRALLNAGGRQKLAEVALDAADLRILFRLLANPAFTIEAAAVLNQAFIDPAFYGIWVENLITIKLALATGATKNTEAENQLQNMLNDLVTHRDFAGALVAIFRTTPSPAVAREAALVLGHWNELTELAKDPAAMRKAIAYLKNPALALEVAGMLAKVTFDDPAQRDAFTEGLMTAYDTAFNAKDTVRYEGLRAIVGQLIADANIDESLARVALNSRNPAARSTALIELGLANHGLPAPLRTPEGTRALIAFLTDPDAGAFAAGLLKYVTVTDPKMQDFFIESLAQALASPAAREHADLHGVLANRLYLLIGDKAFNPAFLRAVKSSADRPGTFSVLIAALAQQLDLRFAAGDPDLIRLLIIHLHDANQDVVDHAATILGALRNHDALATLSNLRQTPAVAGAVRAILDVNHSIPTAATETPALVQIALVGTDFENRELAGQFLAARQDDDAREATLTALEGSNLSTSIRIAMIGHIYIPGDFVNFSTTEDIVVRLLRIMNAVGVEDSVSAAIRSRLSALGTENPDARDRMLSLMDAQGKVKEAATFRKIVGIADPAAPAPVKKTSYGLYLLGSFLVIILGGSGLIFLGRRWGLFGNNSLMSFLGLLGVSAAMIAQHGQRPAAKVAATPVAPTTAAPIQLNIQDLPGGHTLVLIRGARQAILYAAALVMSVIVYTASTATGYSATLDVLPKTVQAAYPVVQHAAPAMLVAQASFISSVGFIAVAIGLLLIGAGMIAAHRRANQIQALRNADVQAAAVQIEALLNSRNVFVNIIETLGAIAPYIGHSIRNRLVREDAQNEERQEIYRKIIASNA